MSTWTKQKGYPVINAKLKGNDMELDQVVSYVKYCTTLRIYHAFIVKRRA
jgi:hypothetical protein